MSQARSRMMRLFARGSSTVSPGFSLSVHAYPFFPSIRITHSLHTFALMHAKRNARLGSACSRIHISPSRIDWPGE